MQIESFPFRISGRAKNIAAVNGKIPVLIGFLAVVLMARVCSAQTLVSPLVNNIPDPASQGLKISPGDMLDVRVFDTPELSSQLRVSETGSIDLPVGVHLAVAGLTPMQAGLAVEKLLREQRIMPDARVTIVVTEYVSEGVSVLGEVNKPGKYVLLGQHNLYDALSVAGGTTDKLGETIVVTHVSDPSLPIRIFVNSANYSTMEQLTKIQPGDVVVASRAKSIFVIGDVGHPGEFSVAFGQHLNVLNAIALANGVNRSASSTKASIIRQTETGVQTLRVNIKKLEANKQEDPVLLPGDILVVPSSGFKIFMESALPASTGAVAGAVSAALIYH